MARVKRSAPKRKTPLKTRRRRPAVGSVVRTCAAAGCAETFATFPSKNRRFCSPRCAYNSRPPQTAEQRETTRQVMLAKDRTGPRNPNFRHGKKAGKNISGWNPKARRETCCRVCGSAGPLDLHHAVPRSICPPAAKRDLRNGITLCDHCHTRWHRGTLVITRDLFSTEEWSYISTLELTGREITGWLDKHYPAAEQVAA
jgi:hypothetical protein